MFPHSGAASPGYGPSGANTPSGARTPALHSRNSSYSVSLHSLGAKLRGLAGQHTETTPEKPVSGLKRQVSLGSRRGPGHITAVDSHDGPAANHTVLPTIPDFAGDNTGRLGP